MSHLGCTTQGGNRALNGLTFEVRAGEVLGIAGVAGNGQTELLEILAGMRQADEGTVNLMGQDIAQGQAKSPRDMRASGLGHIPEDRHHHGLVLEFEAGENMIFGFHHSDIAGTGRFLDKEAVRAHCEERMEAFDVRPRNPALHARNFSGGNQQKIVIAREMHAEPKVLIVGQPTRGVDIGAIEFIHKQLIALRDRGCAILLVSVELDEILGLSDRIMVMNNGEQVGIVDRADADERTLGLMMAGIRQEEAA